MVNREIIEKTLDNILTKCKYGKIIGYCSIPPMMMMGLNRFYEIRHNATVENAFIVNDKGELIDTFEGSEDSCYVSLTEKDIREIRKGNRLHITHNHPSTSYGIYAVYQNMFSKADMMRLLVRYDIDGETIAYNGITAESPTGSRVTLNIKDESLYRLPEKEFKVFSDKYMALVKKYDSINDGFLDEYFKASKEFYYNEYDKHYKLDDKGQKYMPTSEAEKINKRLVKFQKNYVKNEYAKRIQGCMDDFKDIGCELSIRYMN